MSYTTTPPGTVDYNTPAAPTATAPGHTTPPALTNTAPGSIAAPVLTATAPTAVAQPYPNTTPAGTGVLATSPLPLPPDTTMKPAFVGITTGASRLKLLSAAASDVGNLIQGAGDDGNWLRFLVAAGTTAEQLDPAAGALVVHPVNYDAALNAIVFLQQP